MPRHRDTADLTRKADRGAVERHRLRINGIVQGVGFRPFVYRLARDLGLTGFVYNDQDGVLIEIEGLSAQLAQFAARIRSEAPPAARIVTVSSDAIPQTGDTDFLIRVSEHSARSGTLISPDLAVCRDCLDELFDPADRRYRYPFVNCTNCGPRFTIVRSIPYDRPLTSMAVFPMCPECAREYHDPGDRRFHAQPNACPRCGPRLILRDRDGLVDSDDVCRAAVALLKEGRIGAVRGLGGFHLAVDASNEQAVLTLRQRKGRAEKPLAMMAPDVATIRKYCHVSEREEALLQHRTRPIVLLSIRELGILAPSVAPGQNYLGFMLPYTPLYHLLLKGHFDALVMTSGNWSEEPIAIGNDEAVERLGNIADFFVLHDREILQRCDDSIVRVADGEARVIRRARSYVPEPVFLPTPLRRRVLACGGELKNTVALGRGTELFLSQHIGDLDNPAAYGFFEHCIRQLQDILEITPDLIACDLHPDYLSTKWALRQAGVPVVRVQHHHAHLVSAMAENGVVDRTLGIILDGTGYGLDGNIWGGEVLVGDALGFERLAWLRPVAMPGGEAAIKEPWRMALSWLYATYGPRLTDLRLPMLEAVGRDRVAVVIKMIDQSINSPMTTSCGRLFDAVAAMLLLSMAINYEAQAAIALEMAAGELSPEPYPIESLKDSSGEIDVRPLIERIVSDIESSRDTAEISARFHRSLAEYFVAAACRASEDYGIRRVALGGGVFQNRIFFEYTAARLRESGLEVLTHRTVPTNDGGLALGQAVIADARHAEKRSADNLGGQL